MDNWASNQNFNHIEVGTEVAFNNGSMGSGGNGSSRVDIYINETNRGSNHMANPNQWIVGDIKTGKAQYKTKQQQKNERNIKGTQTVNGKQNPNYNANYVFDHIEFKPGKRRK